MTSTTTTVVVAAAPSTSSATPEPSSGPKSAATAARDDDPVIQRVRALRNDAMRHNDARSYDESIGKLREALTLMHDRVFGPGRAQVTEPEVQSMDAALYAQLLNDYGSVLTRAKEYDEAIDVLEDAVQMNKRVFGESHPSFGLSLRGLADAQLAHEDLAAAIKTYQLLRKHVRRGLGVAHEGYIEVQLKLAACYKKQDQRRRALKLLRRTIDDQGDEVNGATPGIGELYMELATLETDAGELESAQRHAEAARAILEHREGQASLPHAFALNALAGVKMAQRRVAEAHELLQRAHAIARGLYGDDHEIVRASRRTLNEVRKRLAHEREEL